jgi:hypothetical protein
MQALERGIDLEARPGMLRDLLLAGDTAPRIPGLMQDSITTNANLFDVLHECGTDTVLAGKLLKKVIASGQDIDYFLTGDGGRGLSQLRFAAATGSPLWAGDTTPGAGITCGPPGQPVTFNHIMGVAEPAPPPGQNLAPLAPGQPARDRYIGGEPFGNVGAENGMLLPFFDNVAGQLITYTEYDLRPFAFGTDRGKQRIVVGTDGNDYYTDDHYKTFKRIT